MLHRCGQGRRTGPETRAKMGEVAPKPGLSRAAWGHLPGALCPADGRLRSNRRPTPRKLHNTLQDRYALRSRDRMRAEIIHRLLIGSRCLGKTADSFSVRFVWVHLGNAPFVQAARAKSKPRFEFWGH